ncbi:MAG: RIP metalloprotease RseP [Bacteroidota bacterium]
MDFIFSTFNAVFPFIIVISILVYVHELGHYWVARKLGVTVEAFSIGFGPELFGWTNRYGTRWKVCLVPLGGYVKPLMDEEYEADPNSKSPIPSSLSGKSPLERIAVAIAGPAANYILAIALFAGVFVLVGQDVPTGNIKITDIDENSAAERSGMQSGDIILEMNDNPKVDLLNLQKTVRDSIEQPVKFLIKRDDETLVIQLTPDMIISENGETVGRIGAALFPEITHVSHTFLSSISAASQNVMNLTVVTVKLLGEIVTGERSAEGLMGPIGIGKITKDFYEQGVVSLITVMAFLSVNLGLINLFPIPLLDGGHIMFYLIELIRGKPANRKVQEVAYAVGFTLVIALILFSTWNDLSRLKVVQFVKNLFA